MPDHYLTALRSSGQPRRSDFLTAIGEASAYRQLAGIRQSVRPMLTPMHLIGVSARQSPFGAKATRPAAMAVEFVHSSHDCQH